MVRAYFFLAVLIPLTFLFATSALLCTLVDASGRSYAFHARLLSRLLLFVASTTITLRGAEHLPPGPVIFMSNHQSNFDILSILVSMPRQFCWIAKKELFDIPVFGISMKRGGYIPLDRSDGRKALKSMDNAAALIRGGKSVVMFPEGTRSIDRRLLPFKRGGFMLALKAGVPVVPVTINGSGRVNPAGLTRLYPGEITITLHPPIQPSSSGKRSDAETLLMEQVHSAISSVLEI